MTDAEAVKRWRYIVCILATLALMFYMSGMGNVSRTDNPSNDTVRALIDQNGEYARRVADLETAAVETQKQMDNETRQLALLEQTLETLKVISGDVEVTGEGITVRVEPRKSDDEYIGHVGDLDLLRIVNELNASGAEAIAINGQRISAFTSIRSVGSHININNQALSPPYMVQAIGNSLTMLQALSLYGGVVETLQETLNIEIETQAIIAVPRYANPVSLQYAKVLNADE